MIKDMEGSAEPSDFPITGIMVCRMLENIFDVGDEILVTDIETLCSNDCDLLGILWHRVAVSGPIKMIAADLSNALIHADQIITLSIYLANDVSTQLIIDDGELIGTIWG